MASFSLINLQALQMVSMSISPPSGASEPSRRLRWSWTRHIVDREREHHLGLHDAEYIVEQSSERLAGLYGQFHSITDNQLRCSASNTLLM